MDTSSRGVFIAEAISMMMRETAASPKHAPRSDVDFMHRRIARDLGLLPFNEWTAQPKPDR